jgi:predicted metal-binding membrane protein
MLLLLLLGGLSLLAWLVLWRWGHSPSLHYAHHAHLHPPPTDRAWLAASFFIGGWTLMTVAMMLPTSLPLVETFSRVAASRPDRPLLVALVVLGFLLVWTAVGAVAYGLALAFRAAAGHLPWIGARGWVLVAVALLGAGLYQFSSLKTRCLDRCRSPFSVVAAHWTGQHLRRHALWLGMDHGLLLRGLPLDADGSDVPARAGNLGWMLGLGAVMAAGEEPALGRALARSVGVALIGPRRGGGGPRRRPALLSASGVGAVDAASLRSPSAPSGVAEVGSGRGSVEGALPAGRPGVLAGAAEEANGFAALPNASARRAPLPNWPAFSSSGTSSLRPAAPQASAASAGRSSNEPAGAGHRLVVPVARSSRRRGHGPRRGAPAAGGSGRPRRWERLEQLDRLPHGDGPGPGAAPAPRRSPRSTSRSTSRVRTRSTEPASRARS